MNNNPKKWGEEDHYLSDKEFKQSHDDLIDLLDRYIEGDPSISPTEALLAQIRTISIYHLSQQHISETVGGDVTKYYRYLTDISKVLENLIRKLENELSRETLDSMIKYLRFQGFVIFGS